LAPGRAERQSATPSAGSEGRKWRDLRKRFLSAALLAPIVLACIWFGAFPWTLLIALAAGGLAAEWIGLTGASPARAFAWLVPASVLAAGSLAVAGHPAFGAGVLASAALLAWATGPPDLPVARLAAGIPYIGAGALALIWLRRDGGSGRLNVLFLVLVVWASDIGAYLAGRAIGGPKLAPRISPAKTWAGAGGGLLAAVATGMAVARIAGAGPGELGQAAVVAAGLGLAAQAGDLLESGIKRRFGVKDSGRLIPGHGGLLDRLDGLLAAAPAAAILALAVGQGALLWN
jgi:phosphatidate cytidylyltransferase